MAEIHARKIDESEVDTFLQSDIIFEGNATLGSNLAIKGKVIGNIVAEGDVYVDAMASVTGNISSQGSLLLMGKVRGDVTTQHRVELMGCGSLHGDVETGRMMIENGFTFNGVCRMTDDDSL